MGLQAPDFFHLPSDLVWTAVLVNEIKQLSKSPPAR